MIRSFQTFPFGSIGDNVMKTRFAKSAALLLVLVLQARAINAAECQPLTAAVRARLVSYVHKQFRIPDDFYIVVTEVPSDAELQTCYRKLRFSSPTPGWQSDLALFLTPDQRYLTAEVLDTSIDPEEARAQRDRSLPQSPSATSLGLSLGPRLSMIRPVPNVPVQARYSQQDESGAGASFEGAMYRDRSGNLRIEFGQRDSSGVLHRVAIVQRVAERQLAFIDLDHGKLVGKMDGYDYPFGWEFGKPVYTDRFSDVEGHRCRLVAFSEAEGSGELWWSEDLQMVLLDDPSGKRPRFRAFDISAEEADPKMFKIPESSDQISPIFDPRLNKP
jgi:hypothetical protein